MDEDERQAESARQPYPVSSVLKVPGESKDESKKDNGFIVVRATVRLLRVFIQALAACIQEAMLIHHHREWEPCFCEEANGKRPSRLEPPMASAVGAAKDRWPGASAV